MHQKVVALTKVLLVKRAASRCHDDSRRKYSQQLRPVGDVRHCRLITVEEAKEDVPSMSSVPVNFLCCLLGQAAHRALHSALEQKGPQSLKQALIGKLVLLH